LETVRQLSNYGCISSYEDIGVAGALGGVAALTDRGAFETAGVSPLEGLPSCLLAGAVDVDAGAAQVQVASDEAAAEDH
jgi:hypothetical protein